MDVDGDSEQLPQKAGAVKQMDVRQDAEEEVGGGDEQAETEPEVVSGKEEGQSSAGEKEERGVYEEEESDVPLEMLALRQPKDFAPEMRKYWKNRYRLFAAYDEGILLDAESWWSVTPEAIAYRIAWVAGRRARAKLDARSASSSSPANTSQRPPAPTSSRVTVVDAFCGAGGNSIQFAQVFDHVYAIDVDPVKIRLASHNARIYQVEERITFICADFMQLTEGWCEEMVHCIFLVSARDVLETVGAEHWFDSLQSPPWGGVGYQTKPVAASSSSSAAATPNPSPQVFSLDNLLPVSGEKLVQHCLSLFPHTHELVLYLPRYSDLDQIAS